MRIADRWQAALSGKANYVCAPYDMLHLLLFLHLLCLFRVNVCYRACTVIGPRSMMIVLVVVTVARRREIWDAIGARTERAARISKKGRDNTLSSRPVNSSFRSSFFLLVFFFFFVSFVFSFALVPRIRVSYFMRNGTTVRRKFRMRRVSSKRKIRSRETFLFRVMRDESFVW